MFCFDIVYDLFIKILIDKKRKELSLTSRLMNI